MATGITQQFIDALRAAEESGKPDPLVPLFSESAELATVGRTDIRQGADGARRFWGDYLKAFAKVRSDFFKVTEGEATATLEWESKGELPNGNPIRYKGVSVIDHAGGKLTGFRTYYDTAAFVAAPAEATNVSDSKQQPEQQSEEARNQQEPHRKNHSAQDDSLDAQRMEPKTWPEGVAPPQEPSTSMQASEKAT